MISKLNKKIQDTNKILEVKGFSCIKFISEGTYGEVYLAKEIKTGNEYAIKKFKEKFKKLSETKKIYVNNEITFLKSKDLKHKYILNCIDKIEAGDYLFLVTDYLKGGSLADALKRSPLGFDEKIVKKIAIKLLIALSVLQSNNIIHRDIKPLNILLTDTDIEKANPVLADFGCTKIGTLITATVVSIGTPYYNAPEILFKELEYDATVDIWSLGMTLYELLFKKTPLQEFFIANELSDIEDNIDDLYKNELIKKTGKELEFDDDYNKISEDMKDFLRKVIDPFPLTRLTIQKCFTHPVFEEFKGDKDLLQSSIGRLQGMESISGEYNEALASLLTKIPPKIQENRVLLNSNEEEEKFENNMKPEIVWLLEASKVLSGFKVKVSYSKNECNQIIFFLALKLILSRINSTITIYQNSESELSKIFEVSDHINDMKNDLEYQIDQNSAESDTEIIQQIHQIIKGMNDRKEIDKDRDLIPLYIIALGGTLKLKGEIDLKTILNEFLLKFK